MKELKKNLLQAKKAVAELIEYFPDQTTQDDEIELIVQAGIALDQLERRLQELWGKDWGR